MEQTKCMQCGGQIQRGQAVISKSLFAWLRWPWASDRLDFASDGDDQNSETIIKQGSTFESFKCVQCGALLLTRKLWFPA